MFNTSTQSECVDWTFSDQQRLTKCSNSDRSTHPKRLGEGSGAAVQWVRDGDQGGFLPATWCAVLVIVLPHKKQQVWLSAVSRVTWNPGRSYSTFNCFWLCLWPTEPLLWTVIINLQWNNHTFYILAPHFPENPWMQPALLAREEETLPRPLDPSSVLHRWTVALVF